MIVAVILLLHLLLILYVLKALLDIAFVNLDFLKIEVE